MRKLMLILGMLLPSQGALAVSPHAVMSPVSSGDVHLTEGFWAERQTVNNTVSLACLWQRANDPETGHVIRNFEIAAGQCEGEFQGTHWHDAWLFKWLEAACYVLADDADTRLEGRRLDQRVDEMVKLIAAAQAQDGYIATQVTARKGFGRFQKHKYHELYTMGHMLTAASVHHRVTGKRNFLLVAEKCANFVYDFFSKSQAQYSTFPNNPSIIMGAVDLFRATGNKTYLALAQHFIDARGKYRPPRKSNEEIQAMPFHIQSWNTSEGLINNQNWVPLRESKEVLGHAVFFTYLYAGAADAYLETGDQSLWDALDRHWRDLTEKKMYVTGGVSPHHMQLPSFSFKPGVRTHIRGDFVNEGVAKPYDLPQAHGYNETCGMVGNMMWNWHMLQASGAARFADIMELNWFNSILSGVEVDGIGWSYANPLRWHAHDHEVLQEVKYTSKRGIPGRKLICCPTNVLRSLSAYARYLYGVGDGVLWVHHYAGSELDTVLPDGTAVKLVQHTEYPWDGKVRFEFKSGGRFTLKLRIPYWAQGATLKVNGKQVACAGPRAYAQVTREWKSGDRVALNLPMDVKLLVSDYQMEETRAQVAVKRGPVVYCIESIDLPEGVAIDEVQIHSSTQWKAEFRPDLLGGVTVLKTQAQAVQPMGNSIGAFRELGNPSIRESDIELIPYFAWHNRGECKMSVWLPLSVTK